MNNIEWIQPIITIIIALLGWVIAHLFTSTRDQQNKRRDIRIQYLLDAYRRLESSSNRSELGKDKKETFESAIADIQLLGTKEHIELIIKYIQEHTSNESGSLNKLLLSLKKDIRIELGLEYDDNKVQIFRFKGDKEIEDK